MRDYDAEVAAWGAYLDATATSGNTDVVTARCNSRSHRGKAPEIWKVFIRDGVYMFVSKIEWRPADRVNMRPWSERALLVSALDNETATDEMLEKFAAGLIEQRHLTGARAEGTKWLAGESPSYVRSVLTSELPGAPELWARCPLCGETERLQPDEVMEMVRHAPR